MLTGWTKATPLLVPSRCNQTKRFRKEQMPSRHPAKYSKNLMPVISFLIGATEPILDPFAGTGRIHSLPNETFGVEIEPEWALLDSRTLVGDATALPYRDKSFAGVVTSPTYANRMADHHAAKDLSKRNTYKHALGRDLHPNNSGGMQWGEDYKLLHKKAWIECRRVLEDRGFILLNIKDHIRKGKRQHVTRWHMETISSLGFILENRIRVNAKGLKEGANRNVRINNEWLLLFRKTA